jgi:uncharacterized protein YbjT (DUF2867 family)
MKKVLVAGASGSLGSEVVKHLMQKNIPVCALVSSQESARRAGSFALNMVVADARNSDELQQAFEGIDVVFSAVGQSVSLFKEGGSFESIDYEINKNLIEGAANAGISRFVYVSIKGADEATGFTLAEVHKRVEDLLIQKNLNYTIIRPVGFFSGFNDLLIMGKQGIIPVPGTGDNKTNPIHQEDLAQVVADNLFEGPRLLSVGGPEVYTRSEIARMVSNKTKGKILNLPSLVIGPGLQFLKFVDDNVQSKLNYFNYVSTHDMVATKNGSKSLKEYIMNFDLNSLPDVRLL